MSTTPRFSKEMLSYFPKAKENGSLVLDLGSGSTAHREVCEYAGFEYMDSDYKSPETPMLGDAHALPLKDECFELILSMAVLEHIRFPFAMMREAYRVLKTGGMFIGTVSFLEPFHDNSFYHHTHLGTYNSIHQAGFQIEHIAPSEIWTVLVAQARMGLFPKMPRLFTKLLVLPLHCLHVLWWKIGRKFRHDASEENRINCTTGAFVYIASKAVS